jgi:tetratricopeptide (TPR) repeat protein
MPSDSPRRFVQANVSTDATRARVARIEPSYALEHLMDARRIAIAIVVAGGGGIAAWFLLRPSDESTPPDAAASPTFVRDVAPLVHRECATCHYEGGPGPFALVTYDDVRDHAQQIVEVTQSGFMPPWLPVAPRFAGERRLEPEERELLASWVQAGAPRGEGDEPPSPVHPDGWQLGEPDLVLELDVAFEVPADGLDVYRNFVLRVPDGPPRYVRAVEVQPGDPKVVHHAVLRVDVEGKARQQDDAEPGPGFDGMIFAGARMPGGRFIGWTPGKAPDPGTDERSWRLIGGSDLVLQVHVRPSGKPEPIRPKLGIHFADRAPTKVALAMELSQSDIDIPPGAKDHRVRDRYTLPADALVLSVYPHAHYIGRRLEATAKLPDGKQVPIVRIDDWNFDWQDQYRFTTPLLLPKGTVVTMDYGYDNSADNPRNPFSPPRRVVHGPASTDEMAELILEIEPTRPQDYAVLDEDFRKKWLRAQVAAFERRLEDRPDDATVLATMAALRSQLGEHASAAKLYARSLAVRPDHASTRVDYAIVLADLDDLDEAEAQLRRAIAQEPELARAHASLANTLADKGDVAAAIASFERSIAIDPAVPEVHNNLGVAYEKAERNADAARSFARAAELSPMSALFRENLGRARLAAGEPKQALAAYREALERNPGSLKALVGAARILATSKSAGDPAEALRIAQQAAKATQNRSPEVLDALAAAHAAAGRFDDATKIAEHALQLAAQAKRPDIAAPIRDHLALYREKKRWVEP